jgi:glycerol-3-phosphate cytidylyltransferase
MKTIITYGTFDLFHAGHVEVLRRARALGDRLIVGCSTDDFNASKGKEAIFKYEDRAEILKACRFVDQVLPERNWEQKADDIKEHGADIFVIGDDWAGKFDFLTEATGCVVAYLPRTPNISTTDVRDVIKKLEDEKRASVIQNAKNLLALIEDL